MKAQLSLLSPHRQQKAKKHKPLKANKRAPGRPRKRPELCFGGAYFANYNPSEQRPIHFNKALHVVLRSSKAKGARSMMSPLLEGRVWDIIKKHADKNGVRIYEYANAGNHLHLLIRVKRRDFYKKFIRSITGLIARAVSGSEKGRPLNGPFWDARPFTRVVQFAGGEFKKVKLYLSRNRCEALGFIPYIKRSKKLSPEWKAFWHRLVVVP